MDIEKMSDEHLVNSLQNLCLCQWVTYTDPEIRANESESIERYRNEILRRMKGCTCKPCPHCGGGGE